METFGRGRSTLLGRWCALPVATCVGLIWDPWLRGGHLGCGPRIGASGRMDTLFQALLLILCFRI